MKQIIPLLKSKQTVFSILDLQKLLDLQTAQSVRNFVSRTAQQGELINVYHGLRALLDYNILELANKIKTPSYISLDYVLYQSCVIFQNISEITLVSNDTRTKQAGSQIFSFHKIKDTILYDPIGIQTQNNYSIASPERALGDLVYLQKKLPHIDAPEQLDKNKLTQIAKIYDSKTQKLLNQFLILPRFAGLRYTSHF